MNNLNQNNNISSLGANKLKKQKRKHVIHTLLITFLAILVVASAGVTYAFLTDKAEPTVDLTFGVLEVGIDFSDNNKSASSFGVVSLDSIVPGEDVAIKGAISSQAKGTNNNISDSSMSAYLRFKFEITGYEDSEHTIPISEELQEDLNSVAQNVKIADGNNKWAKSADGFIYFANNADANHKLKWLPAQTVNLGGEILLNFPTSFFKNQWQSKEVEIKLVVEVFQYDYLEIATATCSDLNDQANCASSVILDYNRITGLGENQRVIDTAYCISSLETFTSGQQFTTNITGKVNTLKVYSAGRKLTTSNYTLTTGTPNKLTVKPISTSIFIVCDPQTIGLVDSADVSQIYETIYANLDGSIPKYVAIPTKDEKAFMGFFTEKNGAGTRIYDNSGTYLANPGTATILYSHFVDLDVIVEYRNTYEAFEGDTAFDEAFAFMQTVNASEITMTTFRDFTLTPSSSYIFTTNNRKLTIQGSKKANDTYPTITFSPTMTNSTILNTQGAANNTIKLQGLNFVYNSTNNNRFIYCINNTLYVGANTTFKDFHTYGDFGSVIMTDNNAVLKIYGGNVGEKDVVFENCSANSTGGAICHRATSDSQSLIVNAKFTECSSNSSGGAVSVLGSNPLAFENCEFISNSASSNGGAIYAENQNVIVTIESGTFSQNEATQGGAVYVNNGTVAINGGEISNNTAETGGAIYFGGGTLTLNGGEIKNNTATANGAGVYATSASSTFIMNGGKIINNEATAGSGAGVYLYSSAFTMNNGEISGNTSINGAGVFNYNQATFTMTGGKISGNTATTNAGGIVNSNSTFTMTGGEISNNISSNSGGGIYCTAGTVNLNGGEIKENTAKNGGGINLNSANATLNLNGGNIHSNTANEYGGGVYCTRTILNINSGSINNNSAVYCGGGVHLYGASVFTMTGGEIDGNQTTGAGYDGGGVSMRVEVVFNFSGGKISNNISVSAGGGIFMYEGTASLHPTLNMSGDAEISGNQCAEEGGGICAREFSIINIESGTIKENTAGEEGGGLQLHNTQTTIKNANFISNTTNTFGGGVYLGSSTPANITFDGNINFISNTATHGGAIYLTGYNLTMNSGNIAGNISETGNCAGIYVDDANSSLTMNGGNIIDNKAENGSGCGVYVLASTFTMNGGNISGNESINGAGVFVHNKSTFTMTGGKIIGNTATSNAGGIVNSDSTVNIEGGEISGNSAGANGGGMHLISGTTTISGNVEISNNTATNTGGGISNLATLTFAENSNINIHNNVANGANGGGGIYSNKAITMPAGLNIYENQGQRGGGLRLTSGGTINGANIYSNVGTAHGGAIYSEVALTMNSGALYSNQAGEEGGALLINTGTFTMNGGEIYSNTSGTYGGGISFGGSTFNLTNGSIYSNTATGRGGGAQITGTTFNMSGGSIYGNLSYDSGGGVYVYSGKTMNFTGGVIGDDTKRTASTKTLYSNSCNDQGGGICVSGGTLNMYSTASSTPIIAYNAQTGTSGTWSGGGIGNLNGTVNIYAENDAPNVPIIKYNYAQRGGGVYANNNKTTGTSSAPTYATITLSACEIFGNRANAGGGVFTRSPNNYNYSKVVVNSPKVKVYGNSSETASAGISVVNYGIFEMSAGEVYQNTATTYGGGLTFEGNTRATITGGKINNNTSGTYGAGIRMRDDSVLIVENAEICNNVAGTTGGGIYIASGTTTISAGTISNNTAQTDGGGIYLNAGTLNINGGTISENNATLNGGGICAVGGTLNMTNGSIVNNVAQAYGGGIAYKSGVTYNKTGGTISGNLPRDVVQVD